MNQVSPDADSSPERPDMNVTNQEIMIERTKAHMEAVKSSNSSI